MTANGQRATTKEKVSTYLYFSSLYFVTVGVLYLWGYWTTFEVNILEYLSLADIVKSTAYPIASTFIFFVIGVIHGHFAAVRSDLPPGGGQNTPIGKFLNKHFPILVKFYFMGTILLLIFGPNQKWLVLPVLFAMPFSLLAKRSGLLESLIPDSSSRTTVIFLLVALPIFSFGHGRLKAANILDGKDYQYVASRIDGITLSDDTDPDQRLRFLGHAGDFLFLLHPSKNTLIIMKFEQAKILQIKEFKVTRQPIFSWDSLISLLR